jgi:ribosomal-protein-alanine N-acetyltransferase
MTSEIRELTAEVEEVFAILQAPSEGLTWFSPWNRDQVREEMDKAWNRGFFEDGRLVAFLFAREHEDSMEITNLGTELSHRRRGLMRLLMAELFRMRPRLDVWLEVHEVNQPAIRLYESLEFKEIGRRRRYYDDGAAALVMKRRALI